MNKEIREILSERAKFSIRNHDEHERIEGEFREAASRITVDSLALMTGLWSRSERIWNETPALAPPPMSPDGGAAGAMSEGARLAA